VVARLGAAGAAGAAGGAAEPANGAGLLSQHASAARTANKARRFITDIVYHVRYAVTVKRDVIRHESGGELDAEPPVVARMIVEIRSDGSRTIARGAIEDVASGQRAAIEAKGGTPFQLALSLVRSLGQLPRFALQSVIARKRLK